MVRSRVYLRGKYELKKLAFKTEKGTLVLLRDIARVELVPEERRGIAELDGEGEAVSGIVVARHGEHALDITRNLEKKIEEIAPAQPEGVSIRPIYDRSDLIQRAITTLREVFVEQIVIIALVCAIFLMHVRSALVAIIMLPTGVLFAFIAMRFLGINSNIMSLAGI